MNQQRMGGICRRLFLLLSLKGEVEKAVSLEPCVNQSHERGPICQGVLRDRRARPAIRHPGWSMSLQKQVGNIDRKMCVIIIKRSQLLFIDWGDLRDTRITPPKPSKSKKLRILGF